MVAATTKLGRGARELRPQKTFAPAPPSSARGGKSFWGVTEIVKKLCKFTNWISV